MITHLEAVERGQKNSQTISYRVNESRKFYQLNDIKILKETEREIRTANKDRKISLYIPENLYKQKLR